jgi:hypothetical protein
MTEMSLAIREGDDPWNQFFAPYLGRRKREERASLFHVLHLISSSNHGALVGRLNDPHFNSIRIKFILQRGARSQQLGKILCPSFDS